MPISKPLQVMSLRLSEEERQELERIARDRNVTLSDALREGLYLLAQDASRAAAFKGGEAHARST